MNEKHYLNEAELADFIKAIEDEPLSKAPGYLKEQILRKASRDAPVSTQNAFLIFSAKVMAGAAAAIALLFLLPADADHYEHTPRSAAVLYENERSLLKDLTQKTNQFCNFITDAANSVF